MVLRGPDLNSNKMFFSTGEFAFDAKCCSTLINSSLSTVDGDNFSRQEESF